MRFYLVFAVLALCLRPNFAIATSSLAEDQTAARVLVYFMVGRDETPEANVTREQFLSHLQALKNGGYTVLSLNQITQAYETGAVLPDNTVAITFDGGDKSIVKHAVPLLEEYEFPYTVFISTDRVDANDPRYLNWDDLKKINHSPLGTIGLHPQSYSSIGFDTTQVIRKSVNNATSRLREKLAINADYFAYPFGEYNSDYPKVIQEYHFKATFGQHSGVAYQSDAPLPLPRFTMTEDYANLDRFRMILNSLPLPVSDVTPTVSQITTSNPAIGFSVPEIIEEDLARLSCFVSGQGKPLLNIIGNRVEIRLPSPTTEDRFRINCTLPENSENEEKTTRWRWFGQLYSVTEP
ncbi:MAG: polysaccharide deacetylase family protein [Alphaproteobacteria bacterium]|nr:polysaccharide deacetylase family protein [Alphaproteobacteria bacterium]